MKNIKVNNKFWEFLKKGVSISLVATTALTFSACSDNSYTTGNGESTSVSANNYQVDDLSKVSLWVVKTDSNEILPLLITSEFNSYFLTANICWEIRDFETKSILANSIEDMPFSVTENESKETKKRLEAKAVLQFEDNFGKIVSKENLFKLLVLKYGQKAEYSLSEIESVCEERIEELKNKKEQNISNQEVTEAPDITIPANATIDDVEKLRNYGNYEATVKLNNKNYRIYLNKNKTSKILVNEATFKEIVPPSNYSNLLYGFDCESYIIGVTKEGNIDKIFIDQNEKIKVETILMDTRYTAGFILTKSYLNENFESQEIPYLYAYYEITDDYLPALINLNTNVVEREAGIYISDVFLGDYSLAIRKNGDVDKIIYNKEKAQIINVAKNIGYDSINYLGNNEILLFNRGTGKENGKTYTLVDNELVLTENVKKKVREFKRLS